MTSAHILTRTPQGPFLLDASASTAVWRERRSSLNVWDFVPNDQRSGSRASDTGIPGSGTTTVTVGRASPCRGAAPRRSPPMCSQYSTAEFPQRGDNPGTWRGSTPRGSRDREQLAAPCVGGRPRTQVKANPDKAQRPVRARVLTEGKVLYMAVPRLADELPFYLLDSTTWACPHG